MRLRPVTLLSFSLVILSGCVDLKASGARKGFTFFASGAVTPVLADGAILSVINGTRTKVRLGTDCLGSQSQLEIWITAQTDTGSIYDIVAQGIPNNGSLLTNVRFLKTCTADDGVTWRHYAADLDKS